MNLSLVSVDTETVVAGRGALFCGVRCVLFVAAFDQDVPL